MGKQEAPERCLPCREREAPKRWRRLRPPRKLIMSKDTEWHKAARITPSLSKSGLRASRPPFNPVSPNTRRKDILAPDAREAETRSVLRVRHITTAPVPRDAVGSARGSAIGALRDRSSHNRDSHQRIISTGPHIPARSTSILRTLGVHKTRVPLRTRRRELPIKPAERPQGSPALARMPRAQAHSIASTAFVRKFHGPRPLWQSVSAFS